MQRFLGRAAFTAVLTLVVGVLPTLAATHPKPALYAANQAARGNAIFSAHCEACHGAHLQGVVGPALKGPTLTGQHKTVGELFRFLSTNMPLGAGGSLSHEQYVELMAFLLRENGYAPGHKPLTFRGAQQSATRLQ